VSLLASVDRTVSLLERNGHACALIGGLAVSARAVPRFTRDADLAVAVGSDDEAEAVVRDLRSNGYRVDALLEQTDAIRLSGVRLFDPDDISVDVLFASSGVERELVERSERLRIAEDVEVPVASVGFLIALKLLSVTADRATDHTDLDELARVATEDDWTECANAVALIEERGFQRGRDLPAALVDLRSRSN